MNDAAARAARTLFQVGTVTVIVQALVAFNVPLSGPQQAALTAVLTVVFTFVQNLLENNGALPTVGKELQSPEAHGLGE